jgi:hypothetical protein
MNFKICTDTRISFNDCSARPVLLSGDQQVLSWGRARLGGCLADDWLCPNLYLLTRRFGTIWTLVSNDLKESLLRPF